MPLTPEQVTQWVRHNGFDPNEYDADPYTTEIKPRVKTQPTVTPTTASPISAAETAARTAATGIVPSLAAIPAGMEVGGAVTAATVPVLGPAAPLAGLVAGLGAGALVGSGVSGVQDWLARKTDAGARFMDTTAKAAEEHPVAAAVGNIVSTLPTMRPNLQMLRDAGHALTTEAGAGAGLLNKLATSQAAQQVAMGGALGGGLSAGEDLMAGHDVDWKKAAVNALGQAIVSDPHGGVISRLGAHSYQGQPLARINPEILKNVTREVSTARVIPDDVAAAHKAALDNLAAERQAIEAQHTQVDSDLIQTDAAINEMKKAALAEKMKLLDEKRAKLEADFAAANPPEKQFVREASPDFRNWTTAKAAEKGVNKVEFQDTGLQTGDKPYGSFTPDEIKASTFAGVADKPSGTAKTNLPEFATEDAASLAGSKEKPVGAASTMIHEPIHAEVYNIVNSERAAQTRVGEQLKAAVESDPRFKEWQQKTNSSQKTWEEYVTRSTTRDILTDPMHKKRSWADERKSLAKLADGTATADDAVRVLGMKFRYDSQTIAPRKAMAAAASTPARTLTRLYETDLAKRDAQPPMEQMEFPKTAQQGTPLSKWQRDNQELPKNTFEPRLGQQEMRLSEPAKTTAELPSGTETFEERKRRFADDPANIKQVQPNPGTDKYDMNHWSRAGIAKFFGGDVSQQAVGQHIKKAKGADLNEYFANYNPRNKFAKNAETGEVVPVKLSKHRELPDVEDEFKRIYEGGGADHPEYGKSIAKYRAENVDNEQASAADAFTGYIEDEVYKTFMHRIPEAQRKAILDSDKTGGDGIRNSVPFQDFLSKAHTDLINGGVRPEGLHDTIYKFVDKNRKEVVAKAKEIQKGMQILRDEAKPSRGTKAQAPIEDETVSSIDTTTATEEEHAGEHEGAVADKNEGAIGEEAEDFSGKGNLSRRLSPAQAKTLNRTVADKLEQAAADMENKTGAALNRAMAAHEDDLRRLLYRDPERAKAIVEALQESPANIHAIAEQLRHGDLKLSEPARTLTELPSKAEDDSRLFVTQTEKEMRSARPFGLQPTKAGDFLTSEIRAKLKTLPPIEQDLLDKAGLQDWLAVQPRVSRERFEGWLKEHGPKLEVHNYGMEGKVSEARQEYDKMTHEWYDNLGQVAKDDMTQVGTAKDLMAHYGWTPDSAAKAEKYLKLQERVKLEGVYGNGPRATSAYNTVSTFPANEPMPEWTTSKEGKNVQRVDVVIPKQIVTQEPVNIKTLEQAERLNAKGIITDKELAEYKKTGKITAEKTLWQPDNLHENLPNTLGWAMIQYKTGPKGEKIAVIAEAQSRWGQEERRLNQLAKEGNKAAARAQEKEPTHPLLKDYNRLILKAAIEQARREGATHVMVSDAETAMMTEGHDNYAQAQYRNPETGKIYSGETHMESGEPITVDQIKRAGYTEIIRKIDQEPGMRLNYDTILPKIAEELTGAKGERVSLGEHKNAMIKTLEQHAGTKEINKPDLAGKDISELDDNYKSQKGWKLTGKFLLRNNEGFQPDFNIQVTIPKSKYQPEETTWINSQEDVYRSKWNTILGLDKTPRPNLIFTNPDGTPKTDVSGRLYPITDTSFANRRASGEQLTMAGKRYSEPAASTTDLPPNEPDRTKQGFFEPFAAQFDKVAKFDPQVAQAMRDADMQRDMNEAKYLNTVRADFKEQFKDATKEDLTTAQDYARAKYRDLPLPDVTPEQKAMAEFWNERVSRPVREHQRELGMPIETPEGKRRAAKLSEWYAADMLSTEAIDKFTNSADRGESLAMKKMWANHIVENSANTKTPVTFDDAMSEINSFVDALGRGGSSSEFNALRKSAGFGLPDALRERDLSKVMERYGRRSSRDLANFQHLESNPYVGAQLGLKDPLTGFQYPEPEGGRLTMHEDVRDAMKFITGNMEVNRSPRLLSVARSVTNALLGPVSGIRDFATVPSNALPYVRSVPEAIDIFRALADTRKEWRASLEAGARTGSHPLLAMDTVEGIDKVANTFNKTAELLRKWQGRDFIEQVNRAYTFSIGKRLAERAVREDNTAFLNKFGSLAKKTAEDGTVTWNTDVLAKAFTDRVQGTYGGRGLPTSSVDGMAAPWFALSRWSLEKSNVIWQDVIKPAYKERNLLPLLTYSLGAFLTGEAIEKLNEEINAGKKSSNPSFKELDAADASKDRYVARLVNIMQMGSFAGMASDALKIAGDLSQGQMPQGYQVPTADFIGNGIAGSVLNFSRAVRDGTDPLDAIEILTKELVKHQVQSVRVANNWTDPAEVDRKNKFRDIRVWKQMTGREVPSTFEETNMALRPEERLLKRASSPEEVEAMLPKIVEDLQERYKDDPWKLHKAIERLKSNSYQTFPSLQTDKPDAAAYYDYLSKALGPEEAAARLDDYVRQSGLNRGKSRALSGGKGR